MSLKYYEIKNLLRSQIGLFGSIKNKAMKYTLLCGLLFLFFQIPNTDDSGKPIILLVAMLIGALYRFIILFERINIKNVTIAFKKGKFLDTEQTKLLISDIDLSLDRTNKFANWSCGILASISIFAAATLIYFFKDTLQAEEISKMLINEEAELQNSLFTILGKLMLLVLLFLLTYYFVVQLFTYDRRFVNTVLKSSIHIRGEENMVNGFWNKFWYIINHFVSGF